jgi:hypothetical protein
MKKEDGKWRIDALDAGEYYGEFEINTDYSGEHFSY